jgi:hypothetical protein
VIRRWLCLPLGLLAACSNQQMYESVQRDQRQKCQTLPESEFQRCMARTGQSFEDYWRDRQAALERGRGSP